MCVSYSLCLIGIGKDSVWTWTSWRIWRGVDVLNLFSSFSSSFFLPSKTRASNHRLIMGCAEAPCPLSGEFAEFGEMNPTWDLKQRVVSPTNTIHLTLLADPFRSFRSIQIGTQQKRRTWGKRARSPNSEGVLREREQDPTLISLRLVSVSWGSTSSCAKRSRTSFWEASSSTLSPCRWKVRRRIRSYDSSAKVDLSYRGSRWPRWALQSPVESGVSPSQTRSNEGPDVTLWNDNVPGTDFGANVSD